MAHLHPIVSRRDRQGEAASCGPDGYLLLGAAETAHTLDDDFEPVLLGQTTFYRLPQTA
jgi:hypothetical protein